MPKPNLIVRLLKNEEVDLHRVVEIENLSFNKDDAYSCEDFRRWLRYDPDLCLAAEIDGRIVGDMICREHHGIVDLASCAIHPDFRRLGIGSALLEEIEARTKRRGLHRIELEVRKSNVSGFRFWQNMGFEEFGVLPGFYPDGEDALRMARRI